MFQQYSSPLNGIRTDPVVPLQPLSLSHIQTPPQAMWWTDFLSRPDYHAGRRLHLLFKMGHFSPSSISISILRHSPAPSLWAGIIGWRDEWRSQTLKKEKKESERSEAQLVLSESKSDEETWAGGTEGGKVHTERTWTSEDCHYHGCREITACSQCDSLPLHVSSCRRNVMYRTYEQL